MIRKHRKAIEKGIIAALGEGHVHLPHLLLKTYKKLGLSDQEAMLIIHIIAFKQRENIDFPTIEQIQERMSGVSVSEMLQRLIKGRMIQIDEKIDPVSGIRFEMYNLEPLYEKMAACLADEMEKNTLSEDLENDLFTAFEQEFGRPLSPMECETIVGWLDQDGYSEELIMAALKEAVFAGKLHFRYIDRILLEWSRHWISTAEEAREFSKRFRGIESR